jgi:hypothetical protein
MSFLADKIGCLESFLPGSPVTRKRILKDWDTVKCVFDGEQPATIQLTAKLSQAWKRYDAERGPTVESEDYYTEIELTQQDLLNIFDPVVNDVITLIAEALEPFKGGEVRALMAVGGFSGSPYLLKRVKEEFGGQVGEVVCPPEPGSAVIKGAVMLGISGEDLVLSRVCRRTYGLSVPGAMDPGDTPELNVNGDNGDNGDNGVVMCRDRFVTFARRGEEVPTDHSVTHLIYPTFQGQRILPIAIYSSAKVNPRYCIATPDDYTVRKESEFKLDISAGLDLDMQREIAVTMFFGRTSIQVTARGVNFNASGRAGEDIPVAFEQGIEEVNGDPGSVDVDEIPGVVGPAVKPEKPVSKEKCCRCVVL